MYWAGTEVSFNGVMPDFWKKYDTSVPFEERVDTVLDWFRNEDIDLGMVYFHQPDKAGHKYGPRSTQVAEQVQIIDDVMGYLMRGIDNRDLQSTLNVIVVSDHGVTNMSLDRMVDIRLLVNWGLVEKFVEVGAICHVFVKEGELEVVYAALHGVHEHMAAYKRAEVPDHWHYSNNRRIGDILLVMDEGWSCTEVREGNYPCH